MVFIFVDGVEMLTKKKGQYIMKVSEMNEAGYMMDRRWKTEQNNNDKPYKRVIWTTTELNNGKRHTRSEINTQKHIIKSLIPLKMR